MKQRKERIVIARHWRGWTEPHDAGSVAMHYEVRANTVQR
jgi:hypothetical protein